MTMDKYIDPYVDSILDEITKDNSYETVINSIKKLNSYLFKKSCPKGYLEECEPCYCTFMICGMCKYIQLLSYIKNERGIDLVEGKLL